MTTDSTRLFERILECARALGAQTDAGELLQSLLSAAAELTGSEAASLLEYDEASRGFRVRSVYGFDDSALRSAPIPMAGSAAGWVFSRLEPLAVEDAAGDERFSAITGETVGHAIETLLAVPLYVRGKPMGVLEAVNKKKGYSKEDTRILEALAALAASAMQTEILEERIVSLRDEANELDRLKTEFIGITSHELRTPLGLILGNATFLKELLGSQHQEQVDSIIRNSARLKEIVESLTNVNNYLSGGALIRARRVSIARLIRDVAASFMDMAKRKNIALRLEIPPGVDLWADLDAGKIAIVLGNLMKNALTFTNEGGEVVVRAEQQKDCVTVAVQDNGVGIPASELSRVFDRFYQVESHLTRRHGGMGLGLSVAKVMVEMHGGRIWAESEEGKGSTFTFLLPVKSPGDG